MGKGQFFWECLIVWPCAKKKQTCLKLSRIWKCRGIWLTIWFLEYVQVSRITLESRNKNPYKFVQIAMYSLYEGCFFSQLESVKFSFWLFRITFTFSRADMISIVLLNWWTIYHCVYIHSKFWDHPMHDVSQDITIKKFRHHETWKIHMEK